jgi:Arc/MetJ-type ribon-helix-helix transcriptional regulator
MSAKKHRLTVTLDPELVEAGQRAVESGQAESVSGWVSAALEDKIRRDRKLALLAAAVADYEQEFGEISPEEIVAQRRADRRDATVVRGPRPKAPRKAKSA